MKSQFVPGTAPPLRLHTPTDNTNTLRLSGGRFVVEPPKSAPPLLIPTVAASEVRGDPESADNYVLPDDEDDYAGLLNDGVGQEHEEEDPREEDVDQPDPGAAGDDDDSGDRDTTRAAKHSGGSAHALPAWLMTPFKARVAESGVRNKEDHLPPLYRDSKTFWFPVEDPFFALLATDSLAPEKMFLPLFFLWDPEPLVATGIPCPLCGHRLNRHGHVPRPRRCVDLDRTFWIIGYRYRCPNCVNPNSNKRTITFRSWDSRIISRLPRRLAVRFPAMLTHRSALSESLFMFMRSCFQSGMGAKQFSDALRVRHLEMFDKLQISYLWTVAEIQGISKWQGRKFRAFKVFDDTSADGYHGFVPSSQWLRDLFDKFMEYHGHDLDQAMSMLSGYINAIDHSFKLAKHIAKVNGEQIFIALLTVTNQKGEIRVCSLVATKSHSQFELALTRMRDALERYGHSQPALFYTDNMADKDFLEHCFPSLRADVVPVEKYSHLPSLEITSDIHVCVLKSVNEINTAMRTIIQDVPEDSAGKSIIFLDSEWNVEVSDRGYLTGRGQTAILQVAYKTVIYIIQVGLHLSFSNLLHLSHSPPLSWVQ
ncbi:hypothetical protein C8R46DRAFT_900488 [Mycena filopes]|nr:hypothetical protein C8R46DRAFT_900488 [Mycena filopes]